MNYESALEQLDSGAVHVVWSGDTKDCIDSTAIVHVQLCTDAQSGAQWSAAAVVSEHEGHSNQCSAFLSGKGDINIFRSLRDSSTWNAPASQWYLSAPLHPDGSAGAFSEAATISQVLGKGKL